MDHRFETRKAELEQECIVEDGMFAGVLDRLQQFIKPFLESFVRYKQCDHATTMLSGLCSDLERKNAESIAYHFGLDRKGIQHFLGESTWDDTPLRIEMANQIADQLGSDDGILIFDPSAFPKSGKESVGVKRQWCGRSGKIDNCQVGVFLAYASEKGHALVDGDLYLPKEWINDKKRLRKSRVPKHKQRYRTRTQMCLELLELHSSRLPHQWITGDDEMGQPAEFRRKLRSLNEQYLLAVPKNTSVADLEIPPPEYSGLGRPPVHRMVRIEKWTESQPDESWERIDVRDGEKGPLIVEVLKGRVETSKRSAGGVAEETCVVIRYKDRDDAIVKQDYYLSNASYCTLASEFARAAKAEHRIEECFDRGKGEAGMGHYEVRGWIGWQHHQTLSMIASWFLNVETRRSEKKSASDDLQSSSRLHCFDTSRGTRMRFTARRQTPRRASIAAKPAGPPVSLEKAQPIGTT
jgi:SRSO17 transposase